MTRFDADRFAAIERRLADDSDCGWLLDLVERMRELLVDADAEISHVLHRGRLASPPMEVGNLIARIRSVTG